MKHWFRAIFVAFPILAVSSADCTFLNNPDEFLRAPEQRWRDVSSWTDQVVPRKGPGFSRRNTASADEQPVQRKNLIDEHIFGRMERDGIRPAPLAGDEEFVRRIYLDLTGRIPTVDQFRSFMADTNPGKRDALIDSLIGSEEFVDKWTMFLGDLFKNDGPSSNVNRYLQGRDTFYNYLRDAVAANKPYWRIAFELITATGDNLKEGAANWVVGGTVPMGPVQDTYDGQAANVAQTFLGINVIDCLLCHDGKRHLDAVNLWGKDQKRVDVWALSAFFAQTEMRREVVSENPLYARFIVSDKTRGEYRLDTRTGNRSARDPIDDEFLAVDPRYPFTGESISFGRSRRQALATMITWDPQFARAAVNYFWEKIMVQALVSPSNGFDLARLDAHNPPPEPWALQPSNPELLEALAGWFRDMNMDMRQLVALIVKSSAYQLSSSYPDAWSAAYVPYYARKFARRLDAEEIHDAISRATGITPRYTMDYAGSLSPLPAVNWAMQFPDTREPRSNAGVAQFLNAFGRGDRDINFRNSSASILQALNMMNNNFVMSRIHADNNGSNVQRLLSQTTSPAKIVEELYLASVSRYPSDAEMLAASEIMRQSGSRRGAELVQWTLLNKLEFLFNY